MSKADDIFKKLGLIRKDFEDGVIRYTDEYFYTTIHIIKGNWNIANDGFVNINNLRFEKTNLQYLNKLSRAINEKVKELRMVR